jgi:hypothetical protein
VSLYKDALGLDIKVGSYLTFTSRWAFTNEVNIGRVKKLGSRNEGPTTIPIIHLNYITLKGNGRFTGDKKLSLKRFHMTVVLSANQVPVAMQQALS